ncbi:MAG: aldehyde dehydrogenase family protein, partial [Chitinophagales bacterium]
MIATAEKTKSISHDFISKLNLHSTSSGACTGIEWLETTGEIIESTSPVDGALIGKVKTASREDYEKIILQAQKAFLEWRKIPAPKRGEIVRQIGDELRKNKDSLGMLVSYEMGKSLQEGLGEVQEMIDICDFAVGLSRQLYGLTMQSERPNHRMYEQWHPLGIVGVITAFNFPVAVWSWNAMLALVCGDVVVWKPSSKVMLCAVATHQIIQSVIEKNNVPEGVLCLIAGSSKAVGDVMLEDKRIPLISMTGSTRIGMRTAEKVNARLGKSILELGGNNAIIISQNATIDLAMRAVTFGAVGTAGQRCTTTRRLIIHENVYDEVKKRLTKIYSQLTIGDPLDPNNHVGPLIDTNAVKDFENAIAKVQEQGGKILIGGKVKQGEGFETGCYVEPCMVEVSGNLPIVKHETFAPILYLMKYKTIEEAIQLHNDVPQGLSSSIFTENMKEMEAFLSVAGSDCGIAN